MAKAPQKQKPRGDELRAAAIVAAELGGETTRLDDDHLTSFADWLWYLPGRPPGVIEVTSHGDHVRASLNNAMTRRPNEFPRMDLQHYWSLYLPPIGTTGHLRYSEVVNNLDEIVTVLGVLESQQRVRVGVPHGDMSVEASILERLGIDYGFAFTGSGAEPGVVILPPGDGGFSGTAAVVAAALTEARKTDNLVKLTKGTGDGTADSRHLFVWIRPEQMIPYHALCDRQLPAEPLTLPPPLTHLWIGGHYRSGDVVWHWDGHSWTDVDLASAAPLSDGPPPGS